MAKYRGKNKHREVHPKIFVWTHTEKAEIVYFQDFRDQLRSHLLMPRKKICRMPHQLIEKVIVWKTESKEIEEADGDRVWCILDVDDFYKDNPKILLDAIKMAHKYNIKIAYVNECFEHWILLHFEKPTSPISRGNEIEKRIAKAFKKNGLGLFLKNQPVFNLLLPFQDNAIKNAKELIQGKYKEISWPDVLGSDGNPSTSIHFLIEEINQLIRK